MKKIQTTVNDILKLDVENKNVLIIGCPASGKSWLLDNITTKTHNKIRTDDYIKFGYVESMYKCMEDVLSAKKHTIVEGVSGYRMLRKGIEKNSYYPDIVIELIISEEKMIEVYKKERDVKKIKSLKGFNKSLDKILSDYFLMPNSQKPTWYMVDNNKHKTRVF